MSKSAWLVGSVAACSVGAAGAATLPVPAAYSTIAAAVAAAADGDTVLVAPGTYAEHGIFLSAPIVIRGETGDPDDVVIDAGGGGRVFACLDVGADTVLRGLTLRNGFHPEHGGAVYGVRASLRIEDCVFRGNEAHDWGGAIALQQGSSPVILRCRFEDNEASYAGAVYLEAGTAEITECTFRDNRAIHTGGAVLSWHPDSKPTLDRCLFVRNDAWFGHGGAISANYGSPVVTRCTFYRNTAFDRGGTIHAWHGSSVTVTHSILSFSEDVESVWCSGSASIDLACSDVFKNDLGDWVGCIEEQRRDNFSTDPLFCDPDADVFTLRQDSPLAAPGPDGCGAIGAFGVGCGPTPVRAESWGRIKARFR